MTRGTVRNESKVHRHSVGTEFDRSVTTFTTRVTIISTELIDDEKPLVPAIFSTLWMIGLVKPEAGPHGAAFVHILIRQA